MAAGARPEGLPRAAYVLPVTYATFSALFGTISVVLAKVLSELVTLWAQGTDIFFGGDAWFTWVTLVGWLGFVGVWLFRMNEALSLYEPLFIIPLLQVNFILFAIISGKSLFIYITLRPHLRPRAVSSAGRVHACIHYFKLVFLRVGLCCDPQAGFFSRNSVTFEPSI